jgi:hypothetical protein
MKQRGKEGLVEWVERVLATKTKLSDGGMTLSDADTVIVLMTGLHKTHSKLRTWLETTPDSLAIMDNAVTYLKNGDWDNWNGSYVIPYLHAAVKYVM